MNWATALRLGRVSNLPTIWTNILAGAVLSDATLTPPAARPACARSIYPSSTSQSMYYERRAFDPGVRYGGLSQSGRFLPAPSWSGRSSTIGSSGARPASCFLALLSGSRSGEPAMAGHRPSPAPCLAATIVYYNLRHKNNPYGPLLMGLCRVQVYLTTALACAGAA